MTLDISGWTIVGVFLLMLVLILAVTTWVFLFWVKPISPDSPSSQQKDKDDVAQNENRSSRNSVTKKYIQDAFSKMENVFEKSRKEDREFMGTKLDGLIKLVESNRVSTNQPSDLVLSQLFLQMEDEVSKFPSSSVKLEKFSETYKDFSSKFEMLLDSNDFKLCKNCKAVIMPKKQEECESCGYNYTTDTIQKNR